MIKFSAHPRKWALHIWLLLLTASAVFAQAPVITSAPTYSGEQGSPPYTIPATNSLDI